MESSTPMLGLRDKLLTLPFCTLNWSGSHQVVLPLTEARTITGILMNFLTFGGSLYSLIQTGEVEVYCLISAPSKGRQDSGSGKTLWTSVDCGISPYFQEEIRYLHWTDEVGKDWWKTVHLGVQQGGDYQTKCIETTKRSWKLFFMSFSISLCILNDNSLLFFCKYFSPNVTFLYILIIVSFTEKNVYKCVYMCECLFLFLR